MVIIGYRVFGGLVVLTGVIHQRADCRHRQNRLLVHMGSGATTATCDADK